MEVGAGQRQGLIRVWVGQHEVEGGYGLQWKGKLVGLGAGVELEVEVGQGAGVMTGKKTDAGKNEADESNCMVGQKGWDKDEGW